MPECTTSPSTSVTTPIKGGTGIYEFSQARGIVNGKITTNPQLYSPTPAYLVGLRFDPPERHFVASSKADWNSAITPTTTSDVWQQHHSPKDDLRYAPVGNSQKQGRVGFDPKTFGCRGAGMDPTFVPLDATPTRDTTDETTHPHRFRLSPVPGAHEEERENETSHLREVPFSGAFQHESQSSAIFPRSFRSGSQGAPSPHHGNAAVHHPKPYRESIAKWTSNAGGGGVEQRKAQSTNSGGDVGPQVLIHEHPREIRAAISADHGSGALQQQQQRPLQQAPPQQQHVPDFQTGETYAGHPPQAAFSSCLMPESRDPAALGAEYQSLNLGPLRLDPTVVHRAAQQSLPASNTVYRRSQTAPQQLHAAQPALAAGFPRPLQEMPPGFSANAGMQAPHSAPRAQRFGALEAAEKPLPATAGLGQPLGSAALMPAQPSGISLLV